MTCWKYLPCAALFVLTGCQAALHKDESDSQAFDLAGTTWVLIEQGPESDGSALAEVALYAYTLSFEKKGTAAFKLDCNRGESRWKADARESEGQLTFGPISATTRECSADSIGEQLSGDLPRVVSYSVYDARLTLRLRDSDRIYVWDSVD